MSYGTDTWCADRVIAGKLARGPTAVVLALYRRTITPRGALLPLDFDGQEEELDYGFGLVEYLGRVGGGVSTAAIPALLRAEFLKDDRVREADITFSESTGTDGMISVSITCTVFLIDATEPTVFTVNADTLTAALVLGTG